MEVKLTDYVEIEGEVCEVEVNPPAPVTRTGPGTWFVDAPIDGIYNVQVTNEAGEEVYNENLASLSELLLVHNNKVLLNKEAQIEADIRAITACIAIEEFAEAQLQINIAREVWII